jgi:hypothetical protein
MYAAGSCIAIELLSEMGGAPCGDETGGAGRGRRA